MKSRLSLRAAGVLLLLATAATAALLARAPAPGDAEVDALRPVSPDSGAARKPAAPPKPKRQIVPGVEVVVNIPSGRLELVQGDSVVRSYPVSVGSARYPTPVGDFLLATVIWNPWWNPPPESEWARARKPEPPGPGNPMGRVKLHMDDLIFIHGTNAEGRLGAPASHGCIRMSNPDVIDLARRLHRIAAPGIDESYLESLSRPGRQERHTVMARSIRMRVTYRVAQLRGDRLHVYPDVYGRGDAFAAQVRGELARGGLDTSQVGAPALARLRQGAARGGASFALADVPSLRPEPPRESGPRLLGTAVAATTSAEEAPPADTAAVAPPAGEPAPDPGGAPGDPP